jgi:DNA-binding response OmpR family regulator
VLVVDDEASIRAMLRDIATRAGHAVVEAANGAAALDAVDRWAPDAIVLDIDMPGLDGFEVLARLRGREATARVPILVLSARSGEADEVRAFDAGATDYATKPFRPRALAARLRALIRR